MKFYDINPKSVYLFIHRPPSAEPEEVRQKIESIIKAYFEQYLINIGKTAERAQKISNGIIVINKILKHQNTAYDNFYLMDPMMYSTYKSKLLKEYILKTSLNDAQIATVKKYLDYLSVFYKYLEDKISGD